MSHVCSPVIQQAWVALFQFLLGLLLAPLNALPFLDDAYVPFSSIPSTLANGGRCLAGINSIVNHTIVDADGFAHGSCWSDKNNKWGAPSDTHCDDCVGAWLPTFFYIVFNCSYNLFIVRPNIQPRTLSCQRVQVPPRWPLRCWSNRQIQCCGGS